MSHRPPDKTHVSIDPNTCVVLEGHQHQAADIEELAESIATLGQLHPALVIEYEDGKRLIAAGRRRWLACKSKQLPLIANIWHSQPDDINTELFARSIRIAENTERRDPSAIDIAMQLQTIRNERQLKNAAEVSNAVGMSEARVKKYLSIISASDSLKSSAKTLALPLGVLLELTKCEKSLGESKTKTLTSKVGKGNMSTAELAKLRGKPKRKKPVRVQRINYDAKLKTAGDSVVKMFTKASPDGISYISDLISRLQTLLVENKKTISQK